MALDINKVEYYNITVDGNAGEGFKLLSVFAGVGVTYLLSKQFLWKICVSSFLFFLMTVQR